MSAPHAGIVAEGPAAGGGRFAREREPLPLGRTIRAYIMEATFETLGALRTAGFAIPFIAIPVVIYLLFGVIINGNAGTSSEFGPGLANYLFSGFAAVGAVMPALFSGVILATEREGNLLRLKRAQPMPATPQATEETLRMP